MRSVMLLVISTFTFTVSAVQAEAKIIQYEINGQVYSYNSKSRAQIEDARLRIEAANRADELRERAKAEREGNFFVRLFGSPAQAASAQADAELHEILARRSGAGGQRVVARAVDVTASVRRTATTRRAPQTQVVRSNKAKRAVAARVTHTATQVTVQPARSARSAVRSVTIDTSTGTQTTSMHDGSVRQEPMTPAYSFHEDRGLSSFVDQVRGRADPIQSRLRW